MRLKDIQHPLCCIKQENNIYRLVNSQMLEPSINSIYCGRIQYTSNKMIYLETGKEVHSQEELINEVNRWASSLEYPADAYDYDPIITETYRLSVKINHFLHDKLGCKASRADIGAPLFVKFNSTLKDSALLLNYEIEETDSGCLVTFHIYNLARDAWSKLTGDFDTALNKLKSLLFTVGLCGLTETLKIANTTNTNSIDLNGVLGFELTNRGVEVFDFKEHMIDKLEECLKQLKNE